MSTWESFFSQDLSLVEARYFYYELLGPKDCQSWLRREGNFEGIIWAMENMLKGRNTRFCLENVTTWH